MAVDRPAAKSAILAFLRALGRDPDHEPELAGTPERMTEAWANDLVEGYDVDVASLLAAESSPAPADVGLVCLRGLSIWTMCPHHLLPARGTATLVYLPGSRITGLGTLSRLIDAFAHRLTLQETITAEVTRALIEHLGARGAACKLALSHACLAARGERKDAATVVTITLAGSFDVAGGDRDLALAALAEGS